MKTIKEELAAIKAEFIKWDNLTAENDKLLKGHNGENENLDKIFCDKTRKLYYVGV